MNGILDYFKAATVPLQALGVSAGGILGVFITLAFFYLIIWVTNKIFKGGKENRKD